MRWLIVEDALRNRKGHWSHYVGTFVRELRVLGDEVTVLADCAAEPFLIEQLKAQPILPDSIWHRMGDGAGALRRYLRVPVHAWRTYRSLSKYFLREKKYDVVFVPTVLVHHLLGWTLLIKRLFKQTQTRIILFFPNTPIQFTPETNKAAWLPAPTAKLFCGLIRSLKKEAEQGRVILGVETYPMRDALTQLTSVAFTYFPHPVQPYETEQPETIKTETPVSKREAPISVPLTFACYGPARNEKGSDVLVAAIERYLRMFPDSQIKFVVQWVEDFRLTDGKMAALPATMDQNPHVEIVRRLFGHGEYGGRLKKASALLLPYRQSSYGLRVSRLAIEAMVNGIPAIVTHGTTLAEQGRQFGAIVLCEDGNVESLVEAIRKMEQNFWRLKEHAQRQKGLAREQFSVEKFRRGLIG
jgi:glycosyltransferase involved in cell wall biosynthesis